jgi:hypothetical protein
MLHNLYLKSREDLNYILIHVWYLSFWHVVIFSKLYLYIYVFLELYVQKNCTIRPGVAHFFFWIKSGLFKVKNIIHNKTVEKMNAYIEATLLKRRLLFLESVQHVPQCYRRRKVYVQEVALDENKKGNRNSKTNKKNY